ncbi:MAG TPA: hypothetical protein VKZ95_04435, partial [Sphingobacteriaceae bacterium]|nr:hypothetical protein [Sphingobacteriaceae bacterium]
EHWATKNRRSRIQRGIISLKWNSSAPEINLPCEVTLIRCANKELDEDNLAIAFKGIRDHVADFLIPGLNKGQADGDPRITWVYGQEFSKIRGVRIRIKETNKLRKSNSVGFN